MNQAQGFLRMAMDFLLQMRTLAAGKTRQADRFSSAGGFIERADDVNIHQTFGAGGFRLTIGKNAIGKIQDFPLISYVIELAYFFCLFIVLTS